MRGPCFARRSAAGIPARADEGQWRETTFYCNCRGRHRRFGRSGHAAPGRYRRASVRAGAAILRIGAGIQMMPNSMKVLRRIGVEERVLAVSFKPYSHLNRVWDTGEVMRELPMPESLFGAPYLCMHRADLHSALAAVVPDEYHPPRQEVGGAGADGRPGHTYFCRRNARAGGCGDRRRWRSLRGARTSSSVRMSRFTRAASPTAPFFPRPCSTAWILDRSRTKWWGPDRHIVIYYTNAARSELYFVTSVPEPAEWLTRESWSAKGDVKEVRKAYEGFHPDVRAVLERVPGLSQMGHSRTRAPASLERWAGGRFWAMPATR